MKLYKVISLQISYGWPTVIEIFGVIVLWKGWDGGENSGL